MGSGANLGPSTFIMMSGDLHLHLSLITICYILYYSDKEPYEHEYQQRNQKSNIVMIPTDSSLVKKLDSSSSNSE